MTTHKLEDFHFFLRSHTTLKTMRSMRDAQVRASKDTMRQRMAEHINERLREDTKYDKDKEVFTTTLDVYVIPPSELHAVIYREAERLARCWRPPDDRDL